MAKPKSQGGEANSNADKQSGDMPKTQIKDSEFSPSKPKPADLPIQQPDFSSHAIPSPPPSYKSPTKTEHDFSDTNESIQESLLSGGRIGRNEIQQRQKDEAKNIKQGTVDLLRKYLPQFVFATDPRLPKHKPGTHVNPTILQQQVKRAIASAELNVYLSYISSPQVKGDFLKEYTELMTTATSSSKEKMEMYRDQRWKDAGSPQFNEDQKKVDKHGEVHIVKAAGTKIYNVHTAPPLNEINLRAKLDWANNRIQSLEKAIGDSRLVSEQSQRPTKGEADIQG